MSVGSSTVRAYRWNSTPESLSVRAVRHLSAVALTFLFGCSSGSPAAAAPLPAESARTTASPRVSPPESARAGAPPRVSPPVDSPEPTAQWATLRDPTALDDVDWTFYERFSTGQPCGVLGTEGMGPLCDPQYIGHPRVYEAIRGDGIPRFVRRGEPPLYDVPLAPLQGASALVVAPEFDDEQMWIAGVRNGGVVLSRVRADTGAVLGTTTLTPPDALRAATAVQLSMSADRVTVFVRAERPWRAVVAIDGLVLLDRRDAGLALADFAGDHVWTRARGVATLAATRGPITATGARIDAPGWVRNFDDPLHCRANALLAAGDLLLVANHCPASSGAALLLLDIDTGTTIADLYPGSVGTVGFSRYSAQVDLSVEGNRAYLRGNEAGGHYLAVVDLTAHRTLGRLIWQA